MRPQDVARLLILSALWGCSFIFMRVAAPVLGALPTATARVAIAALALIAYAAIVRVDLHWRERWKVYLFVGLFHGALPFSMFCWAELRISASLAAILNATSPLFSAIFAAFWLKDPLTLRKVAGILVALAGVALLAGWSPGSSENWLAVGACLIATTCYGLSATYTKACVRGVPPLAMTAGTQIGATLYLLPLLAVYPPLHAPSLTVAGCVVALALVSTAFGFIFYFRLIADVGPTKALAVTFLMPIFGVLWDAIFLGEPVTALTVGSMAIILAGTALVTLGSATGKAVATPSSVLLSSSSVAEEVDVHARS